MTAGVSQSAASTDIPSAARIIPGPTAFRFPGNSTMSESVKILAFAGSLRKDSYNKQLAVGGAAAARAAGAVVRLIDLADFPLPLFDEDLEAAQGAPEPALRLKRLFLEHDALLIASPEYNSSVTAVLKNALDWVSRAAPGESPLACFAGKTAALLAASPGALGGLRGLVHLRSILGNIQVLVLPQQLAVPAAHQAFTPDGTLKEERFQATLRNIAERLVDVTARLKSRHGGS